MEPPTTPSMPVTVAAGVAAAGIAAAMLLAGPGGLVLAVAVVLAGVQLALLLRVRHGAVGARRFLLAWSGQAGLTYPFAGDPGVASALVYLGVGLVFAVVVVVGLVALGRLDEPVAEQRSGDTQPLPVAED